MQISGAVALITGGASGLGEATVRRLASAGAKVVLVDFDQEKGRAVAESQGDQVLFVHTDVAITEQVQAAVRQTIERFGRISILVSCAGTGLSMRTVTREEPHRLDIFTKIIETNLIGTFDSIRWSAFEMAKNEPNEDGERGVIVNTSSAGLI